MFCSQCGTELVNGTCPNCAPENAKVEENAYEPDYVEVKTAPKKKNLVLAIVCLATGIASIIWGLFPAGIAALITGSIYKKKNEESHAMVKAGTICGVIGILLWVLAIAVVVAIYLLELVLMIVAMLLPYILQ